MREKRKHTFLKDIRHMMYGYGDVKNPRTDTATVLEAYSLEFIKILLINTSNMARIKGKTKTDDLLYILKRDRRKYTRVKNLLLTNEELNNARKAFDYEELEKE